MSSALLKMPEGMRESTIRPQDKRSLGSPVAVRGCVLLRGGCVAAVCACSGELHARSLGAYAPQKYLVCALQLPCSQ